MSHGTRRESRERALELLYEAETKGVHPADVVAGLPVEPDPYAVSLATGVGDHVDLLDHVLGARARGWTVERMAALDRAVLRLGSFELAFEPDQPEGVVINEAVELVKRFSTDESPRFVNGVLAAVHDDVRADGAWCHVSRPSALLVDMDGVIRHWDEPAVGVCDEVLGLPPGTFAAVALGDDMIRRANDGTLSHHEWRDEVADVLAAEHGSDREAVLASWSEDNFAVDEPMVALLRAVRASGTPVACVSNATFRLEADIGERGIGDAFDAVVNSSRVGVVKPDPAIYELAAEVVARPVGDCLFFDDRAGNVHGALAVGMPACRFTTPARFEATLRRVGLLT